LEQQTRGILLAEVEEKVWAVSEAAIASSRYPATQGKAEARPVVISMITVLKVGKQTEVGLSGCQPRRLVSSHRSLPSRGVQILAIFGGLWSVVCGSSDNLGPFCFPLVGGGFGLGGYPHGVHQA
jgi:hypothetical protein